MELQHPDSWEAPKLDELIIYAIGGDWGKAPDFDEDEYVEVSCIRGSEFRHWKRDRGSTASLRKVKLRSLASRQLKEGDILVEVSGGGPEQPVGRTILIDKAALAIAPDLPKIPTNFVRLARPSTSLNSKYLNSFLEFFYASGEINRYQGGSNNLRNLKFPDFLTIQVPLPPLSEQKRIVTKIEELFSELDAGEESFKQARKQLGIYRQSLLKQAFEGKLTEAWRKGQITPLMEEWTEVELADITQIIDPNPSHRYPSYAGGKIPLLATKQMEGRDGWDPSSAKLTTEEFYQQRVDKHGFDESDVIFARKGRLGLARKPPKFPKYAFSHTVFIVRPSGRISSDYLLWVLRPDSVVSWLMAELNTGAGVPTLGKGIFGRLPIHLPPLDEQQEIVRLLEEQFTVIEQNEREIDAALKRSEALRQSILKRAFSGQLVPQDPTDEPASQLLTRIQAQRATAEKSAKVNNKTAKKVARKRARKQ